MPKLSGLTIRQHERREIELSVEFVVADESNRQVRFSPASAAVGQTTIRGKATDLSSGGIGMETTLFLPRLCEGMIRIYSPTPVSTTSDGSPVYEVIFEHPVKVRRVFMTGHEPTYGIGASFIDPAPDLEDRVRELLDVVAAMQARSDRQRGAPDA